MVDSFDGIMERLLCPMDELGPTILDTTYFLKKTGSLVYTEGYWHPSGRVVGKIINYPCTTGTLSIHDRKYESVTKGWENGVRVHIPHDRQLQSQFQVDPALTPLREPLVITEFHYPFELTSMKGWFCGHRSMRYAMETYPAVDTRIRQLSELFGVPLDRLGVTGSLAYGHMADDEDIDLVFSGTPQQNMEIAQQIWRFTYTDPKRRCVEFGKFWPLRFYHDGVVICCFFVYSDRNDIPVLDETVALVRQPVVAYGTVADNLHSLYMPLVVKLGDVYIDGARAEDIDLIIYDSSMRGEFYSNERVRVSSGRLVKLTRGDATREAIVVVDAGDVEKERFVRGVPAF